MPSFQLSCVFAWVLVLSISAAAEPVRQVAVSIAPQRFFVERLLGNSAEVLVVIPPTAEHEHYEPGISQLRKLSKVEAFIAIGHPQAGFENTWTERLQELRGTESKLTILRPAESLPVIADDMHYWTSPRFVSKLIPILSAQLASAFPELAPLLEARSKKLVSEIVELDNDLSQQWAAQGSCTFLVYHAAWTYFAKDYRLTQLAFEVEGKEPSLASIARTMHAAKQAGVKRLFIEPQRPASSVQAFADELGVPTAIIDPLAEDWERNLRLVSQRILEACSAPS